MTTSTNDRKQRWIARPAAAHLLRAAILVVPFIAAWIAIRLTSDQFVHPADRGGFFVWLFQAMVVSLAVSAVVGRLMRRFTPLPALFAMTLVFPDHAPSRFKVALRAGTVNNLVKRQTFTLPPDAQKAAEQALDLIGQLAKHERLTRGHTERVRAYADVIGRELGLDDDDLDRLQWGALLHDVGKLRVPSAILSKPDALTPEDWATLRQHPADAAGMLAPLNDWLGDWILAASQHHERWDGEGYPKGLAGEQISLAGRIIAVADAYDVITSRRSYKPPLSAEEARRELVSGAGTHFDPTVVRAMLEAGLQQRAPQANPFSWIFELPAVARLINASLFASAATTLAAVTLALPLMGSDPTPLALDLTPNTTSLLAADEASSLTNPSTVGPTTEPPPSTSGSEPSTTDAPPTTTPTTSTTREPPSTTVAPSTTTTTVSDSTPASPCERIATGETNLAGADLADCDFDGVVIDGADLSGADLRGADLSGTVFTNFNALGADFTGADLSEASFSDGSFVSSNLTQVEATGIAISRVDFGSAAGTDLVLDDATIDQVSFGFAALPNLSLQGVTLTGVNFNDAILPGADFSDASMANTGLIRTDLTDAIFTDAQLQASEIDDAILSNADLTGANLSGSSGMPVNGATAIHNATICSNGSTTDTSCW